MSSLTSAPELQTLARQWLQQWGFPQQAEQLQVLWNSRMRSTAGYAKWPLYQIELNPALQRFEGETLRTLKHELAHLLAHARNPRRNIQPHGREWQQACIDLGIPGESARHRLPLPRHQVARHWIYQCPHCYIEIQRTRAFKRYTACLICCKNFNAGQYHTQFQFRLVQSPSTKKPTEVG